VAAASNNSVAEALPITSQPIMPEPDSYRVFGFSVAQGRRKGQQRDVMKTD